MLSAVVVLVGGGCGSDDDAKPTTDPTMMKLSVELQGDLAVSIKDRVVSTTVIVPEDDDSTSKILGVQPIEPIAEGPIRVMPGFALNPFRGDGRYTIEAGAPEDAAKAGATGDTKKPGERSSVRVNWWSPDISEGEYYQRREKPCTVEVEDDGRKGRLRCPQMTQDGSDKRFSLDFRWERP